MGTYRKLTSSKTYMHTLTWDLEGNGETFKSP